MRKREDVGESGVLMGRTVGGGPEGEKEQE